MAASSEAKLFWGSDGSMFDWEVFRELTCCPLTKTCTLGERPEFAGAGAAWETTAGPVDDVLAVVVAVLAGGVLAGGALDGGVAVLTGGVLDGGVAVLVGGVLDGGVAVLAADGVLDGGGAVLAGGVLDGGVAVLAGGVLLAGT